MQLYSMLNFPPKSTFVNLYRRYKKIKESYKLKKLIRKSGSLKIVLGASGVFDDNWIPTDIDNLNLLKSDNWKRYFQPNSIDAMLAEHVWEHLTPEDGLIASKNCFKYLQAEGYLRIAVPDGYHPDQSYIDYVKVNGSGPGSDDHKVLYTHKTLQKLLEETGFTVRSLEYFDKSGKFHAVDWNVKQGKIFRSKRFDHRNQDGSLSYTSLIVDAYKS